MAFRLQREFQHLEVAMKKHLIALLALVAVMTQVSAVAAGAPFYGLIVNGSANMNVSYDGTYLTVKFRRTRNAAGRSAEYIQNVPPGSAAWPDRPLSPQEPLMLKQKMTRQQADAAYRRLRENGGYWKFYCRNTNAGYFEVSQSQATYATVKID
jgi:hypothetical protein